MKKFVKVISLLFTILIFTGCSTEKKADSTASSAKTEASSTVDKKKKAEEEKAKEEAKKKEAGKKKQEEIAKKVTEADTAMKTAETNLTDETLAAAKTAIEAIPDGNNELAKRLETATANLEAIKQQTAAQAQQQVTKQVQQQQQQNQVQNDADGNGIPDDSPYNNTTPEERARGAQMEAEANAQAHAQQNQNSGLTDQQIREGVQNGTFGNTSGGKQWLYQNGYTDADGNLIE